MAKDAKKTQNNKKEKNKKTVKNTEELINKEVKVDDVVEKDVKKKKEKVKKERNNEKIINVLEKVDDNRKAIILFIVGFLLATLIFRCIFWPDRIATLSDGTQPIANIGDTAYTADDLYGAMKEYFSVNVLINEIDDIILTDMYPSDDDMEDSVNGTAEYYYSVYESNNLSKEDFLSQYGFASEKDFLDSLRLDYRRNQYYDEYVLSLISEKDVEKYYENDVFGDVDSKHILVSIDEEDGLSDEDAKKLANEIIGKLNKGTSWDDVISEYKDQIINEELGYRAFNADLESAYLKECKNLDVGSYSKTPVLTSYGYHIVYKIDQKEKPKLEDVKDDVKDVLAKEKKNNDSNLYNKALVKMREEAKLEFVDTKLKEEYNTSISSYK